MKHQIYMLFRKGGINMSYKHIYVHNSCLCRVPGELRNTYQQCSFEFMSNLPLYSHIQMAKHLLSVIRMIHKNQGGMGWWTYLENDPPTSNGLFRSELSRLH